MNKEKKANDFFAFASGILKTIEGFKGHSKEILKSKIAEKINNNYHLVAREEFDELKEIIIKTREENDKLKKRILALEKKIK